MYIALYLFYVYFALFCIFSFLNLLVFSLQQYCGISIFIENQKKRLNDILNDTVAMYLST